MKYMTRITFAVCLTMLWATFALAAPKTFIVMPFTVNGPQGYDYLSKAIPSSLASRMAQPGAVELAQKGVPSKAPTSVGEVQKAQSAAHANYAVWGSVSIINDQATLDVTVRDTAGKEWKKSSQGSVGGLIGSVQAIADVLKQQAFGLVTGGKPVVNQMNPGIVVNETGQQDVYLNPQFRYQGSGTEDGSRLRSSLLNYTMVDFAIGDFAGNGRTQVAVLGDHKLHIYDWNGGKIKQLAEHTITMSGQCFSMRSVALAPGKPPQLVVATFNTSDNQASSYIYTFDNGKLREYARRSPYFLSVARLPPTYMPTLVGQRWDSVKLFRPGVYIATVTGDTVSLGTKVALPANATAFNFTWMPGSAKETEKLLMFTTNERIKVFGPKNTEIHQTMNSFSGSSVGMEHYKVMDGLGVDKRYQLPDKYFAPMRMITADLEGRGEYVVLVNKPISTASQFFDRYRFFPQGEIHALYWDGVGLGLKWKTRRIRGSVVNLDLGDLNNDGVLDLVVGVNTHPGALGVGSRNSLITAYPLDLTQVNPYTAPDMSDFEN